MRFAASAHAEKGSNREVADLSQSSSTSSVQARSPVTRSAMHKAVETTISRASRQAAESGDILSDRMRCSVERKSLTPPCWCCCVHYCVTHVHVAWWAWCDMARHRVRYGAIVCDPVRLWYRGDRAPRPQCSVVQHCPLTQSLSAHSTLSSLARLSPTPPGARPYLCCLRRPTPGLRVHSQSGHLTDVAATFRIASPPYTRPS